MYPHSKQAVYPATLLICIGLLVLVAQVLAEPKQKEAPAPALFHKDRDHLWNRVHAAFFIRVGPDDRSYGEDRLEPLLWHHSKYLLEGKPADRAVAVLEEFIRDKGETLIDDPLKRAILQRDLWLVSNWLASKQPDDTHKKLARLLAEVIRQLALTPEQVAKLPDNYALTVAEKKHAAGFDAEKPERSYLPADLFQPDGPWVSVGRTEGPTGHGSKPGCSFAK